MTSPSLPSVEQPPLPSHCPICGHRVTDDAHLHWAGHVEADAQLRTFSWTCACGPACGSWASLDAAAIGLALHVRFCEVVRSGKRFAGGAARRRSQHLSR